MLLAFDTATQAVTVALYDEGVMLSESTVVDPLRHGELLAPAISAALAEAGAKPTDLTQLAVGVGPGPFTGLRVGIVTARTMGAVLGIPVVGVCTLDVLAAAVDVEGPFLVATDARRKEVYWARYVSPTQRVQGPEVGKPAVVATEETVAGIGAEMYADSFPRHIGPVYPKAVDLARLVGEGSAALLPPDPLYLRRPDAVEPGARKRVL